MPETALETIAPLRQALALATEAGDVPALRDVQAMATALRKGAQARGMGVEAENAAAEVILRAERAIGHILLAMSESGERAAPGQYETGQGIRAHKAPAPPTLATVLQVPRKDATLRAAAYWQSLARIPDDVFEAMLHSAREGGERLAKHNFYRASAKPSPAEQPTPTDPDFARFRAGAYGLLGWADDGPTRNGFLTLPLDELRQAATLIRALADAYNAAKAQRA